MPTENPFLRAVLQGQASPRFVGRGSVAHFLGGQTEREFLAQERGHVREQARRDAEAARQREEARRREEQAIMGKLIDTYKTTFAGSGSRQQALLATLSQPEILQLGDGSQTSFVKIIRAIEDASMGPEMQRGFEPGSPVPAAELSDAPPPGMGGARRPGVALPAGELTQALGLSAEQARQLQAASRLDPGGVAKTASGAIRARVFPEPVEGKVLAEGGMLVHPQTGEPLGPGNPKAPGAVGLEESEKEIAKRSVARLNDVVEDGVSAGYDELALAQLDALNEKMLPTGGPSIVRQHLARLGMNVDGATDVQVFDSLVDRLTPAQRQGLPGAASDKDIAMFKSALPSLMRTPEGNRLIIATLKAMNADRRKRAEIAESVFEGTETVPGAMRKLRNLPSPLRRFLDSGHQLTPAAPVDPAKAGAENMKGIPDARLRSRLEELDRRLGQ